MRNNSERAFSSPRFYVRERKRFFVVYRGERSEFSTGICGKPFFAVIRKYSGFVRFFKRFLGDIPRFVINARRITSVENENPQKVFNNILWKTYRFAIKKRRAVTTSRGNFPKSSRIHKNSILFLRNGCSSAFPNRVIHRGMWITLAL